jgi:4-cresol dehydrogenase (hydroxylating)
MAVSELIAAIGDGRAGEVRSDPAFLAEKARNTAGIERRMGAIVYPGSTEQVVALVQAANQHGAPLYPVSTGRNWGMGSRVPVRDGGVVVDLSRMDRIRAVDATHGYVVIEPGVTQRQLADHLSREGLPYVFNVTGSASFTSIMGCSLDRGVGYFAGRVDSLAVSEVVLGTGQVLRPGFGHFPGARTAMLYRHGVGPSLDGLFFQSSLGIVTAATFELMPRPERCGTLVVTVEREESLAPALDAIAGCCRQGLITTAMHIANRERSQASMGPLLARALRASGATDPAAVRQEVDLILAREVGAAWSAVTGVMGSPAMLGHTRREVARALRGVARVRFFTDQRMASLERLSRPLAGLPAVRRKRFLLEAVKAGGSLVHGVPNDASLGSIGWPLGIEYDPEGFDPDASDCGLLYVLPIVPLAGEAVREVVDYVRAEFGRHGFRAFITLNILSRATLEGVINVAFRRSDPGAVARAHACIESTTRGLLERGYPPYRLGVQAMGWLQQPGDDYWGAVRSLKQAFDPRGILAPGRYDPLP